MCSSVWLTSTFPARRAACSHQFNTPPVSCLSPAWNGMEAAVNLHHLFSVCLTPELVSKCFDSITSNQNRAWRKQISSTTAESCEQDWMLIIPCKTKADIKGCSRVFVQRGILSRGTQRMRYSSGTSWISLFQDAVCQWRPRQRCTVCRSHTLPGFGSEGPLTANLCDSSLALWPPLWKDPDPLRLPDLPRIYGWPGWTESRLLLALFGFTLVPGFEWAIPAALWAS